MKRSLLLAVAALLALPATALADRITLRNGKVIEGTIVAENADSVQIERRIGSMTTTVTYQRFEILKVERIKSPAEEFEDAFKEAKTAADFVKLAKKAREDKLEKQALRALDRAIELDKNDKEAHELRGDRFDEGKWWTDREWKLAHGYVEYAGELVKKEDLEKKKKEEADRARKAAEASQEKYGKELEGVSWGDAFIIESKHYIVKCNSTKEVAQRYSDFLEKIYVAYDKVFSKYKRYWNKKSTVYIFRNIQEFQEFTGVPEGVGGFYVSKSPNENAYPDRIVAAYHGRFGSTGDTRLVLAHEGTHQYQHILCAGDENSFAVRPAWWKEGLAVYFGDGYTLDKKGNLKIGIPRDRLSYLQRAIKAGQVPNEMKISDFVRLDYGTFSRYPPSYPYAWSLVYYFMHRGEDKKGNQQPVEIGGKKVNLAEAFEKFFKAVTEIPPFGSQNYGAAGDYYGKKLDDILGFPVDAITDDWKKFVLDLDLPKLGKVQGQTYLSTDAAFSIQKPGDWRWDEEDVEGDEAIRIENEKTTGLVKVLVDGNMDNKTLADVANETETMIGHVLRTAVIESRNEINLGGFDGVELIYKGTPPERPAGAAKSGKERHGEQWVRHVIIVTLKRTYHLICVADSGKEDENKAAFEQMVKSFKILKEKE
jgi:hypothetical protein